MPLAQRFSDRLSELGVLGTARWLLYQVEWRLSEWRLGIETRKWVTLEELGSPSHSIGYEPIDYRCFGNILDHVDCRPGESVLLDYGCGKGRAVVLAATRPFKRVVGIERSEDLSAAARQNVDLARPNLACDDVRIVNGYARNYCVPDDVSVIYLFNPFYGPVLVDALARIRESIVRAPRELTLVYSLPVGQRNEIANCSWLEEACRLSTGFWTHIETIVYQNLSLERQPRKADSPRRIL